MAYAQAHFVELTTNASGAATGVTPVVSGRIHAIRYVKDDFANGSTFTITTKDTGQNVWVESSVNATATRAPRQPTHDSVGVASLYAGSGEPVEDHILACNEEIQIVIASGGDTKSGTFIVMLS